MNHSDAERDSRASAASADLAFPTDQSISASRVAINVTDNTGAPTQLSLQQFLDLTGAGKLYMSAAQLEGPAKQPALFGVAGRMEDTLPPQQVQRVLGNVWKVASKGQQSAMQAYWFQRKEGLSAFKTGSVVGLVSGELVNSSEVLMKREGMCMVVADGNACGKGEPMPSPEDEPLGHWCCFIGQVPVMVTGKVSCGDSIGPSVDGSGMGQVTTMGASPVVGIALTEKLIPVAGVVTVLCFAGLSGLTPGVSKPEFQAMLDQTVDTNWRVQRLEGAVEIIDTRLLVNEEITQVTEEQVRELTGQVEDLQQWRNAVDGSVSVGPKEDLDKSGAPHGLHPAPGSFGSHAQSVPNAVLDSETGLLKKHRRFVLIIVAILSAVVVAVTVSMVVMNRGSEKVVVVNQPEEKLEGGGGAVSGGGGGGGEAVPGGGGGGGGMGMGGWGSGPHGLPPPRNVAEGECMEACGMHWAATYEDCDAMKAVVDARRECTENTEPACCANWFFKHGGDRNEVAQWLFHCGEDTSPLMTCIQA